jgi:hypothetical protein
MKQLEHLCVQLDAPIVPDRGLGGLWLRTPLGELQDLFLRLALANEIRFELAGLFEARYQLANGAVEVAVDVRNGKVFRLSASTGYQGLLFSRIAVGMTVREALTHQPDLYYDEAEEMLLYKGSDGVSLDVPAIDPSPEEVPEMTIRAINVFASEIGTREGQEGKW